MKKLSYIFILLVTLPIFLVVSCEGDKSDDGTPPTISDVRFNVNDTIHQYLVNGDTIIIKLNDSTKIKVDLDIDTLVIGKRIRFRGHFADDGGLSTAYFHIWGDTLIINDKTASYNMRRLMPISMFGQTDLTIGAPGVILADPLPLKVRSKDLKSDLDVRSSRNDNYYFSIRCSDIAGNVDSTSYKEHKIVLLTREEVIKIEKEKLSISSQ